jgi:hypothetical protein
MLEVLNAREETEENPVDKTVTETRLTSIYSAQANKTSVSVGRSNTFITRPASTRRKAGQAAFKTPILKKTNRSFSQDKTDERTPARSPSQVPRATHPTKTTTTSPISKAKRSSLVWISSYKLPSPSKSPVKLSPVPTNDFYDGEYSKNQKEGNGKVVYSNGDEYSGSWRKNLRHGAGTYFYKALNLSYDGDWDNNSRNGNGTMTFSNGDVMEAGWEYNAVSETKVGRFVYKSGDLYEGTLRKGLKHGTGVIYYSDGAKYEGGWRDDYRDGLGLMLLGDGGLFQGHFTANSTNGIGMLLLRGLLPMPENPFGGYGDETEPDYTALSSYSRFIAAQTPKGVGNVSSRSDSSAMSRLKVNVGDAIWVTMTSEEAQHALETKMSIPKGAFVAGRLNGAAYCKFGGYGNYQGTYKDGKRSGYGRMTYKDPDHTVIWFPETAGEYQGNWLNDERHGQGTMKWEKNISYEGQWRQDRRHNVEGTMTFESGDVYEGSWQDNIMHGNAVFRMKDGREFRGRFRFGIPEPGGVIVFPSGDRYEGELLEMQPNGYGKTKLANGNAYEGQHETGLRQGYGTMTYPNGSVYVGDWKNGLREGLGIMTYTDTGETYEGDWTSDKRHGFGTLLGSTGEILFSGNWREDMKEGQGRVAYKPLSLE